MGDNTGIEWADATWNPIRARHRTSGRVGHHCEHVSEGCRFCYAERMNGWRGTRLLYKPSLVDHGIIELFLDEDTLDQPLRWRRPRTIFPCSMTDLFARFVPDATILRIFTVMAGAKHHRFIVLTKRPERMRALLARMKPDGDGWITLDGRPAMSDPRHDFITSPAKWPLANVILGTSIEDRRALDRLEDLRATPAATRVISAEPLLEDLGPVDLTGIGWVIAGGESGNDARPLHPAWACRLRDQCRNSGVPFFFKQWGSWKPDRLLDNMPKRGVLMREDGHRPNEREATEMLAGRFDPRGWQHFAFVGKKAAGRTLDGRTWDEAPRA